MASRIPAALLKLRLPLRLRRHTKKAHLIRQTSALNFSNSTTISNLHVSLGQWCFVCSWIIHESVIHEYTENYILFAQHLYGPASRQIILRFGAIYDTQSIFYSRFGLDVTMRQWNERGALRILTFSNKLAFVAACSASVRRRSSGAWYRGRGAIRVPAVYPA